VVESTGLLNQHTYYILYHGFESHFFQYCKIICLFKIFMPQFDFYSFFSQVIGFSIAIFVFYFFFLKLFLTKSTETLKFRKKLNNFLVNVLYLSKQNSSKNLSQILNSLLKI
jgi:hypothetical protein